MKRRNLRIDNPEATGHSVYQTRVNRLFCLTLFLYGYVTLWVSIPASKMTDAHIGALVVTIFGAFALLILAGLFELCKWYFWDIESNRKAKK